MTWEKLRLGDVCSFQNGRAFKKSEWAKTGLPIIRIQNLKNEITDHNYYSGEYDDRIHVRKGNLLLSWSGTIKPFVWPHEDALLNQHVFKVTNNKNIKSSYLYYLFQHILDEISKKKVGIGLQHITKKTFENFEIFLPPLQEQEKIVEKLDKVFENIDKLTEDLEKNIENSKNIFFSYLNETFRGNNSGDLTELEKLSTYISRGLQPKYTDKSKTLVINQRCIRDNQINFEVGRYHDQNIKKVSDDKKIQIGDILINSTGVGTLGRVAQVKVLPSNDVTVDTHVTIFRPDFNILNKEFTNWLFIYLENLIEKMGVGASGQTELRREDLKNIKIINPPNEKIQQDIADKLNKLKNPYDNYLRLKEDLLVKYSILRKSILNKEFSYE